MPVLHFDLMNETATAAIATQLAQALPSGVVYLSGDLGAGKTTLTRAWLLALGHIGAVKSPTYTWSNPIRLRESQYFISIFIVYKTPLSLS